MNMRTIIDKVIPLYEADILPFPTAKRAAQVERDRHRFHLLVFVSAPPKPGQKLNVRVIENLDNLSLDELVQQMHNYPQVHRMNNMWASASENGANYYMRVLVGNDMASEQDMNAIEARLSA
jgi:hypothetical protein